MTSDNPSGAAGERETIATAGRIDQGHPDRGEADRTLRALIAPIAALLMIVIAALIWNFGSPRADPMEAPLPQCAPPPGERITI